MEEETLIVGAGPAGLAVAACLQQKGRPCLLVDRAPALGWSWRNHYERLHLHTAKEHSALPGLPFPAHYPRYPSRDQVVAYLEAFAVHHGLKPRLGVEVRAARPVEGGFEVETSEGTLRTKNLVIASGYNAIPKEPTWPGQGEFQGRILHSRDYRSGAAFAGHQVVVVGNGNSGAEIALDLWEQGAKAVTLVLGGPRFVVPRDVMGLPAQVASILYSKLPRRLADALARRTARLAMGNLKPWGFSEPKAGPLTEVDQNGRVALIDVGTIALIKQGKIHTLPGIERFTPTGVVGTDGRAVDADAVVLATGYRAGIDRFLKGCEGLLNERGLPTHHGAAGPVPGLYFTGFRNPVTGALREMALEAQRIATCIAQS